MIAVIDPVTLTILLSAIGGAVAGKKGKNILDGLSAAQTATDVEKGIESVEGRKN
ncbi:MAG: hypothetical protein Fur0025_43470 [Oscillatoriaceae cyanobacterium]